MILEKPQEDHKVQQFFQSTQTKFGKNDPIQARFTSNLQDLVSVDGLPFSFVNGMGCRNLVDELNPRVTVPDRVTLSRELATTVNQTVCMYVKC